MAVIGWGKPRIVFKDLDASTPKWEEAPTPVQDSTQLTPTKGDKTEAKLEGGANEDVKYNKNTYALTFNIRKAKGRKCPIPHSDGVVAHNYAIALQPEDPEVPGIAMEKCTVSVEDSWSSSEGGIWAITFDALQPASGNQVKDGVIAITGSGDSITSVTITPEGEDSPVEVAPSE